MDTMAYDLLSLVPQHRAIVSAIRQMFPETADDDLADTIAGESNLPDAIVATLRAALVREATGKALGELIDQMTARKRRIEDGAKTLRAAALQAIQEGGVALPIRAPDMSISVGHGKPRVQITEPDRVPDHLCTFRREPSKTMIAEAIAAGEDVPGVVLGNSAAFISVHRS
jgi:hypothetical protein